MSLADLLETYTQHLSERKHLYRKAGILNNEIKRLQQMITKYRSENPQVKQNKYDIKYHKKKQFKTITSAFLREGILHYLENNEHPGDDNTQLASDLATYLWKHRNYRQQITLTVKEQGILNK